MPIAVVCPQCAAKLNAPDSAAGKKVKCPKCQSAIVVPQAQPLEAAFEVVDDEPAPPKKPATKPKAVVKAAVEVDDEDEAPRKKARAQDEDDDEDDYQPKKKKKKKRAATADDEGGVSMTRNIVMGVVLLILLGVAGYIFFIDRPKKKDETAAASNSDEAQVVNPKVSGGPGAGTVPKLNASGGGGGGPQGGGGGGPKKSEPIGTPGQPTTLSVSGFKVTFPGPYTKDVAPPNAFGVPATMYMSEDRTTRQQFGVAAVDFAPNSTAADKKALYDKFVKQFTEKAPKSSSITRRPAKVAGLNAEEFTIQESGEKSGGGTIRVLQTDAHIYMLLAGGDNAPPPADKVKKFFDSFELTGDR